MKTPSWIRVPVMPEVDDRLHEAFPDTTSGVRNVAAHFDGQCGSHRQGMKVVAGLCFCIGGVVLLALMLLLGGCSPSGSPFESKPVYRTNSTADPSVLNHWKQHFTIYLNPQTKRFEVWDKWADANPCQNQYLRDFSSIEEARLALTNRIIEQAEWRMEPTIAPAGGVETN